MPVLVLEVSSPLGYSFMGDGPDTGLGEKNFLCVNDFQTKQLTSLHILLLPSPFSLPLQGADTPTPLCQIDDLCGCFTLTI